MEHRRHIDLSDQATGAQADVLFDQRATEVRLPMARMRTEKTVYGPSRIVGALGTFSASAVPAGMIFAIGATVEAPAWVTFTLTTIFFLVGEAIGLYLLIQHNKRTQPEAAAGTDPANTASGDKKNSRNKKDTEKAKKSKGSTKKSRKKSS